MRIDEEIELVYKLPFTLGKWFSMGLQGPLKAIFFCHLWQILIVQGADKKKSQLGLNPGLAF